MKLRKAKKGFTLVELVVVIAIIAILSTVSVVANLGFTKKAKVTNDVSLTTQMNTMLVHMKHLVILLLKIQMIIIKM